MILEVVLRTLVVGPAGRALAVARHPQESAVTRGTLFDASPEALSSLREILENDARKAA